MIPLKTVSEVACVLNTLCTTRVVAEVAYVLAHAQQNTRLSDQQLQIAEMLLEELSAMNPAAVELAAK